MGVGAGLYMCDVVVKSSRSLSHLLMSSCTNGRSKWNTILQTTHVTVLPFKNILNEKNDWAYLIRTIRLQDDTKYLAFAEKLTDNHANLLRVMSEFHDRQFEMNTPNAVSVFLSFGELACRRVDQFNDVWVPHQFSF